MGSNEGIVGKRYRAPRVYEVGREKIREFAQAVKTTHAAHYDVDAARGLGYSDVVAPPTFAVIVSQRAEAQFIQDKSSGLDFSRLVHAEQSFKHHRPIVAGDALDAVVEVTAVRSLGSGMMINLSTEITADEEQPVASVVSKLLVSGGAESSTEGN